MKRLTTIMCCLMFMISGAFLAFRENGSIFIGHQTANAMPPPIVMKAGLPSELRLKSEESNKPDVITITDTVVQRDTVVVVKPKYVRVPKRESTTVKVEKLYMPVQIPAIAVNNQISGGSEEKPPVESQSPKQSDITLTVDGQVVYSTENYNHSTEEGQ